MTTNLIPLIKIFLANRFTKSLKRLLTRQVPWRFRFDSCERVKQTESPNVRALPFCKILRRHLYKHVFVCLRIETAVNLILTYLFFCQAFAHFAPASPR